MNSTSTTPTSSQSAKCALCAILGEELANTPRVPMPVEVTPMQDPTSPKYDLVASIVAYWYGDPHQLTVDDLDYIQSVELYGMAIEADMTETEFMATLREIVGVDDTPSNWMSDGRGYRQF